MSFKHLFEHLFEQLSLKQTTIGVGNHKISGKGVASPPKFVNHFLLLSYFNTQSLFYYKFFQNNYNLRYIYISLQPIGKLTDPPPSYTIRKLSNGESEFLGTIFMTIKKQSGKLQKLAGMETGEGLSILDSKKPQAAITKLTNEEIIASIRRCRGLYYLAAEHLGVTKSALAYRITNDPELEAVAKDQRGKMLDKAETKLMEAVDNGEQWAIQLMLKTLGRDRGYVERQEVHSVNQVRLQVVEEIVDAHSAPEVMISVTGAGMPNITYKPKLPESFDDGTQTGGD